MSDNLDRDDDAYRRGYNVGVRTYEVRQQVEIERLQSLFETILKHVEPCKGEQSKFEEWATCEKYDMHEHPLHYLFLDQKTYAARQGWKAALRYIADALKSAPGFQAPQNSAERLPSSDAAGAGADTRSPTHDLWRG